VDLSCFSTASSDASLASVAWMYLCTPTRDFLRASKDEEYSIFFFILALSGHQDIRNSFCFLDESVVPWHWCSYSKSYRPYLKRLIMWMFVTNVTGC